MSDFDAYESEMGWISTTSDGEIERALSGHRSGDAELDELASFADGVRAACIATPDGSVRDRHLSAVAESTGLLAPQGKSSAERVQARPIHRGPRRLSPVLTSLLASAVAKFAMAGVAVAATTGGLAATGNLPDPAQEAVARVGEKIGIDVPGPRETPAETPPDDIDGARGPADQASDVAKAVTSVVRNWEGEKGCEFGHTVAAAAGAEPGECKTGERGTDQSSARRSSLGGKPEGTPSRRPDGAGKPEGTPSGQPDGAGKPDTGGSGGPADAGKPEGTPSGQPDGAGKPEGTPGGGTGDAVGGRPDGAGGGRPDNSGGGRPESPGKP